MAIFFFIIRTYIKVLSLHEWVKAELSLLLTPVTSDHAVSHHHALPHPGIHVEGDVPRPAHHEVDAHSAAHRNRRHFEMHLFALTYCMPYVLSVDVLL